ncbi:MAG: carboxylesterase family protein, partial [Pseudomonadota bacterium]
QGAPSYLYHFTRVPPSKSQTIGAFHAAEIFFVFGSHTPLSPLSEADKALTTAMGQYWTNFAKSGDPNGAGLPEWPSYARETDLWMTFNPSIHVKPNVRKAKLDILERALERRIAAAVPVITPPTEIDFASLDDQETSADRLEP